MKRRTYRGVYWSKQLCYLFSISIRVIYQKLCCCCRCICSIETYFIQYCRIFRMSDSNNDWNRHMTDSSCYIYIILPQDTCCIASSAYDTYSVIFYSFLIVSIDGLERLMNRLFCCISMNCRFIQCICVRDMLLIQYCQEILQSIRTMWTDDSHIVWRESYICILIVPDYSFFRQCVYNSVLWLL